MLLSRSAPANVLAVLLLVVTACPAAGFFVPGSQSFLAGHSPELQQERHDYATSPRTGTRRAVTAPAAARSARVSASLTNAAGASPWLMCLIYICVCVCAFVQSLYAHVCVLLYILYVPSDHIHTGSSIKSKRAVVGWFFCLMYYKYIQQQTA